MVTGLGLALALAAVAAAALGGPWVPAGAAVVVLSGVFDGLDGAVAVLTGRTTRWGYVLDSVADRLSDAAYLLALYLLGAPGWICAAAGLLTFLQEYARARAGAAGMSEIGVVTVWERPTRVIVTAVFLLLAALPVSLAGTGGRTWAAAGAAAWLGLAAAGTGQLLLVVRRRLAGPPDQARTGGDGRDG